MKHTWLVIDSVLDVDSSIIYQSYQKLLIEYMGEEFVDWMSGYQHKDQIKEIMIKCYVNSISESSDSIQYILSSFNFLEKLCFNTYNAFHQIDDSDVKIKLTPNMLSKLTTLEVGFCPDHPNNILQMFSNIPTIKKLLTWYMTIFPKKVKWQLEELIIPNADEIDDDNCKKFLESQQFTLKKLSFPGSINFAYFIMQNLSNLESLTLSIDSYDNLDDKFLIRNSQLKRLNINIWMDYTGNNVLETVLNHYNNIQFLSIRSSNESRTLDYKQLINIKLKNLSHLLLKGIKAFPFLNANIPNIRVLAIACFYYDEDYDYSELSQESMKNVEKLSLDLKTVKDAIVVLSKCPKLTELNLKIVEWNAENDSFISSINEMLAITNNMKCLGINKHNLLMQQMSIETLLDQISNIQIGLKTYDIFNSMLTDEWGLEGVEHIHLCT
ncbi:hypothetical protein ACKWTF_010972 [Chironomus riparius]